MIPKPYFVSGDEDFTLFLGDCVEILKSIPDKSVNAIFADPPYFLSNGGISVQSGKVVCVDKGEWDKGGTPEKIERFNEQWIEACRDKLADDGTIWISGTYHNIFSVANVLTKLGFKILNVITWAKTNPPPNVSCRYFTYSTEFVIWARKHAKTPHFFDYDAMRMMNGDKQMTDVWQLPAIAQWEKTQGKHPTQKPLRLLYRVIMAATKIGDTILDPFAGSSTTGIAANLLKRKFIGIERGAEYVDLGIRRRLELDLPGMAKSLLGKMTYNPNEPTVLINHADKELRELMIKHGICYLRAGDGSGSILARPGFDRMQYVLLHTKGSDGVLFRLEKMGCYQIWSQEQLRAIGFSPKHALAYIVLKFCPSPIPNVECLIRSAGVASLIPRLMGLSDAVTFG